jgi:phosphohistidine phosphatase
MSQSCGRLGMRARGQRGDQAGGPVPTDLDMTSEARTLYLLRHAAYEGDGHTTADHDRPLTAEGRRAAQRLARFLRGVEPQPVIIVCSTALRARQTVDLLASALGDVEVIFDAGLYEADAADLLRRIQRVPAEATALMVVGHNPGLHVLALELTESAGGDDPRLAAFPAGALACIAAPTGWSELCPGVAYLEWLVVPTELGT